MTLHSQNNRVPTLLSKDRQAPKRTDTRQSACYFSFQTGEKACFSIHCAGFFALLTLAIITLSWAQRPNVVFVLADDFSSNLVAYMPHLQAMQKEGLSFDRYFVTNSLCCPSRATIFTGQMPHNTQVMTNEAPTGGYEAFVAHHNPAKSFAPA